MIWTTKVEPIKRYPAPFPVRIKIRLSLIHSFGWSIKNQQTIEPLLIADNLTRKQPCPISAVLLYCRKLVMNIVQILGLAAGSCTTIAFLPQVIKTWKSGSAKDLSLGMFSFFCFGVLLWLIYGIIIQDVPVIVANMLTLILASSLLYFKLRFKA